MTNASAKDFISTSGSIQWYNAGSDWVLPRFWN
jgi:hypothetical protein